MGILDQIEILINNRVTNHEEKIIIDFSIQRLIYFNTSYIIITSNEDGMTGTKSLLFNNKKEVAEYLNDNCWQILYE